MYCLFFVLASPLYLGLTHQQINKEKNKEWTKKRYRGWTATHKEIVKTGLLKTDKAVSVQWWRMAELVPWLQDSTCSNILKFKLTKNKTVRSVKIIAKNSLQHLKEGKDPSAYMCTVALNKSHDRQMLTRQAWPNLT